MDQDPQNNPSNQNVPPAPLEQPVQPAQVQTSADPAFVNGPAAQTVPETPIQPEFQTTPQPVVPQPTNPVTPAPNDPGKTLGIVSIVLDCIGLALIGLILGIVSRKKSKAAGASTTLGTIGIALGIIFTLIGILFWSMIALTAYHGVQKAAKNEASLQVNSAATSVMKSAEFYYAEAGSYPASIADFDKYSDSKLKDLDGVTVVSSTPTDNQVEYKRCSEGKAFVSYLDPSNNSIKTTPLGISSEGETVSC